MIRLCLDIEPDVGYLSKIVVTSPCYPVIEHSPPLLSNAMLTLQYRTLTSPVIDRSPPVIERSPPTSLNIHQHSLFLCRRPFSLLLSEQFTRWCREKVK